MSEDGNESVVPPLSADDILKEDNEKTSQYEAGERQAHAVASESALKEIDKKNKNLEIDALSQKAKIEKLESIAEIRDLAVGYAKFFILCVPVVCLSIFVLSAFSFQFEIAWGKVEEKRILFKAPEMQAYTQAVLIIAPIAFVGAVLGFLLRGVFSPSNSNATSGLPEAVQTLTNANE